MNWKWKLLSAFLLLGPAWGQSNSTDAAVAPVATNEAAAVTNEPAAATSEASTATNAPEAADHPAAPTGKKKVVLVAIDDEITSVTEYMVREATERAKKIDADAIVIEMATPGGRVDYTENIIRNLAETDIHTITYVVEDAHSAGSLIAMSTRRIYMNPLTQIGDSIAIIMSPDGILQMDKHTREKATAPVDTFARMYAKRAGRNPDIVSAMVRLENSLAFPEEEGGSNVVIVSEDRILELSNEDASKKYFIDGEMRPLISEGTVDSLDEVLAREGLAGATIERLQESWAHRLAKFVVILMPLLGIVGFLLIQEEIRSPGFGIFGILGIACFLLLFYGHRIAGLAGYEELILFGIRLGADRAGGVCDSGLWIRGRRGAVLRGGQPLHGHGALRAQPAHRRRWGRLRTGAGGELRPGGDQHHHHLGGRGAGGDAVVLALAAHPFFPFAVGTRDHDLHRSGLHGQPEPRDRGGPERAHDVGAAAQRDGGFRRQAL